MSDPYDLERFVAAQAPVIADAQQELTDGRKRTHWMWFVFPQLAGLGHSAMSRRYAISGLDEARAYLAHPLLGARLRDCTELASAAPGGDALALFGSPDDMKFRSCMTLFAQVADDAMFADALDRFFGGAPDADTLRLLAAGRT